MLKGQFSKREKQLVLSVRSFCEVERRRYRELVSREHRYVKEKIDEMAAVPFTQVDERVWAMTGVARRTILRFSKQDKNCQLSPKNRPGREEIHCPDWVLHDIRLIIMGMYSYKGGTEEEKDYPNIRSVRDAFYKLHPGATKNADQSMGETPLVGLTTFRKWINRAGFTSGLVEGKPVVVAHEATSLDLITFLTEIQKYRDAGWKIFFFDETWVNRNHGTNHMWRRASPSEGPSHFLYEGGMELPSTDGERLILLHMMSEDGLLEGAEDIIFSVKNASAEDYHSEMTDLYFEKYVKTKLLPNLPDKSVVVLDKASYHMHLAEEIKRPSSSGWAKDKIVDWLIEQGETQPREVLNKKFIPELLVDCRKWGTEKQYKVDQILQSDPDKKVEVLRTKYRELNPIELVWAIVKDRLARQNTTSTSLENMRLRVLEVFKGVTVEDCRKAVLHCRDVEQKYLSYQQLLDSDIRPIMRTKVKEAEESDESGVDEEETAAQQQTETQKQGASEADLNFLLAVMKQTTEITGITPGITPPRSKVKGCTCRRGCGGAQKKLCPCKYPAHGDATQCNISCKCKGDCSGQAASFKGCGCPKGNCRDNRCSCFWANRHCSGDCGNCVRKTNKCQNEVNTTTVFPGSAPELYFKVENTDDTPVALEFDTEHASQEMSDSSVQLTNSKKIKIEDNG